MSKVDNILNNVLGNKTVSEDVKALLLKTIKETISEVSKVNEEFAGRRIGEIDLDIVYSEEFKIPTKSKKFKK